jgi:hypothetical protein
MAPSHPYSTIFKLPYDDRLFVFLCFLEQYVKLEHHGLSAHHLFVVLQTGELPLLLGNFVRGVSSLSFVVFFGLSSRRVFRLEGLHSFLERGEAPVIDIVT